MRLLEPYSADKMCVRVMSVWKRMRFEQIPECIKIQINIAATLTPNKIII